MDPVDVLIAGAGPTGLALALWLARLGVRVRIVDRSAAPGVASRAFIVQARTLEFYDQIGIAQDAVARGLKVSQVHLWARDRKAATIPIGDFGAGLSPFPFALALPQNLHERFLAEHLEKAGVTVERGITLIDFASDESGVRARLQKTDNAEGAVETVHATFLCGADGARSAVRAHLGVGFPGGTYPYTLYVADVEAQGPTANGSPNFCFGTHDFCGVFPLKSATNVRLIGVLPAAVPDAHATFESAAPEILRKTQLSVSKVNWFSTYHAHHRVADRFRVGRVFLLGDAAHIHSPAGAQGLNTGVGDAVNLAWKLALVLSKNAPYSLLDSYEPERIGFARRLVQSTDRAFGIGTDPGWVARFLRMGVLPVLAPRIMRIEPVRKRIFLTVSQLNVRYRSSPLSAGRAGALCGGDRLPWLGPAGVDNFAPLRSLRRQVHVYGRVPTAIQGVCERLSVDLHVFPWQDAARQAGFLKDAVYLVRPDGYIALADSAVDSERLIAALGKSGPARVS